MARSATPANAFASENNRLLPEDRPAHNWYRFVLSYPPHLVRDYLLRFSASAESLVLDPFCGTGTTLVECKRHGIPSVGIEGNPLASFASSIKLDWSPDPSELMEVAAEIANQARAELEKDGLPDHGLFAEHGLSPSHLRELPPELNKLLLKGSISPKPLHKVLVLKDLFDAAPARMAGHLRLAVAKALVSGISNLKFGPEVGVGRQKDDVPVVELWLAQVSV